MKYDYHDATLRIIRVDWPARTVDFEFAICTEQPRVVCMTMTGMQSLRCPHESPWGESASVNDIRISEGSDKRSKLEIEMQSGDVILGEGQGIRENDHA